ncbi:dimeric dihydrodiol dehydrogenase [Rhizoctonia solani AG-1 IA]|uniref:D-xylose 1-dehydrogenase (NADP(+), D-xylono-1,5-lactone-forming) n=1 Tax=Thanatephorus cucumeris (strain AG1-IA) TaxID=983506 RepID=L8X069_THACA|nr:dimeric dihydrodiol dehydrogenase [Rhizoctonia solani AG-1 IA]
MAAPFELRWGILGAGHISSVFVKDLLLDPKTRDVTDVIHKVAAVGSRDAAKAQEFIDKHASSNPDTKAYGSYEEVVGDKVFSRCITKCVLLDVTCLVIGTPHTHHYSCTSLALRAGKHVLCEKPFTSNAAELKSLISIAKENNVFLMESINMNAGIPKTHRILDPKLGGGALLDLGPYPFVWAAAILYEHALNKREPPSHVAGSMVKTKLTGVDSSTTFVLNFDRVEAQAILSCSITISTPNPALVVRCRKGNIIVAPPIYRPKSFIIQYLDEPGSGVVAREESREFSFEGGGWHFQADEVARCIRDGKLQSDVWSLDASLVQMSVFDEWMIRSGSSVVMNSHPASSK